MKKIRTTYKRFSHKLTAKHSYGFGVHSPFLFGLTKFIIYNKNPFYIFEKIELLCQTLANDRKHKSSKEKVVLSKNSLDLDPKRRRERQLLFRVVNDLRPQFILELGAELGITTAYLTSGNPKGICTTVPAADALMSELRANLQLLGVNNVNLLDIKMEEALTKIVSKEEKLDLVFINSSVPVDSIRLCFKQLSSLIHNKTVFILSDMHRSKEREVLWDELTSHKSTTAYIDLFSLGFLFFRKDLAKKRYKMRL